MTNKQNIIRQITDIQDLLSVYEPKEVQSYLHSLSFDYDFITLTESFSELDDLLLESISESFSNCPTLSCTLQSMIDLLS